jgi:Ca2+:H+ antiporter
MSILANPSDSIPRQRSQNLRIQDEELGEVEPKQTLRSPKVVSPGAESQTRRRFQEISSEISQTLKLQENKEGLVKFWDQFTRKGKRKIGVMESLRAIVYSSCTSFVFHAFFIPSNSLLPRVKHISNSHSDSMGIQFSELE